MSYYYTQHGECVAFSKNSGVATTTPFAIADAVRNANEFATDDNRPKLVKWMCHVHPNDKDKCKMALYNGVQYHGLTVTETDRYAQTQYNARIPSNPNEFWEELADGEIFVTVVGHCNLIQDYEFVRTIFKLFELLDKESVVYTKYNTARDMVKRHLITDCGKRVILCNKHLLKKQKNPKIHYTSARWEKQFLLALFPKIASKTLPPDIPAWAVNSYKNATEKTLPSYASFATDAISFNTNIIERPFVETDDTDCIVNERASKRQKVS